MIFLHGAGHFHPENVIDNQFLEDLDIGCDTGWTLERVGIETRRTVLSLDYIRKTKNKNLWAAHEASLYTNAQTGAKAAEMAISRAGISKDAIGLVISGSCSPQHCVPAEACTISAELEIEASAFDINSACSSLITQLSYIETARPDSLPEYILIVCPENNTRVVNYSDRNSAVLWGDGSSAMVLSTKIPSRIQISETRFNSSPKSWNTVVVHPASHFEQVGRTVQTFGIKKSVAMLESLKNSMHRDQIANLQYIGHQANLMMLNSICLLADLPLANHYSNVQRFGNCGAAGAPSVFSQNWHEWVDGDLIALLLVGAGLSWGRALISVGGGDRELSRISQL